MLRSLAYSLAFLFGLLSGPSLALEPPKSPPVLSISGAIEASNADGMALFDRAMLETLDWREIETFTSFTDGKQTFAGPTLVSVLQAIGVTDGLLRASAVNDYTVEIPVAHAAAHDVILAMDHNGQPMRVRTKGPIWVVYPQSESEAELQTFDSQMIWQLVRLEVVH